MVIRSGKSSQNLAGSTSKRCNPVLCSQNIKTPTLIFENTGRGIFFIIFIYLFQVRVKVIFTLQGQERGQDGACRAQKQIRYEIITLCFNVTLMSLKSCRVRKRGYDRTPHGRSSIFRSIEGYPSYSWSFKILKRNFERTIMPKFQSSRDH